MQQELKRRAVLRLVLSPLVFAAVLFLPAGTLSNWQGWLFIAVFSAATISLTTWMAVTDAQLLKRRMRAGPRAEKERSHKIIVSIAFMAFFVAIVLSALDHRFGWSHVPTPVNLIGSALIAISYFGFYVVFRENTFGAATVRVEEGQRVISTGPYKLVRHPMYTAGLITFIAMPLALGSWWALLTVVPAVFALAWRIIDEERLLKRELPGYADYTTRVRWHMIPGIF